MNIKNASLSFESFDGGGPEYSIFIENPKVISYKRSRRYIDEDHEDLDGAGYRITFCFTEVRPGKTGLTVSARSPVADNYDFRDLLIVNDDLSVTIKEIN